MIAATIRSTVRTTVHLLIAGVAAHAAAQEVERFDAPEAFYPLADNVAMYAEPADTAYQTGYLPFGQPVEVYAIVDGSWVAIRPPAGQFDWLAAEAAHLLSGGLIAEVIKDGTPAWIDSADEEDGQLKWQLRLRAGQQVRVLKHKLEQDDDGRQFAWYQIEPPAGEFRWVKRSELSTVPPRQRSLTVASDGEVAVGVVPANYTQAIAVGEEISAAQVTEVYEEPIQLAPGEQIIEEQSLQSVLEPGEYLPPRLMDSGSIQPDVVTTYPVPAAGGPAGAAQLVPGPRPLISITPVASVPQAGCASCGDTAPCESCQLAAAPCTTCGDVGCETCEVVPSEPPVNRVVKPLGRLLGLVGLSVVEADRAPLPCGGCALAGCPHCAAGVRGHVGTSAIPGGSPAAIGTLPSRLDTLPRPMPSDVDVPIERSLLLEELSQQRQVLRDQVSRLGDDAEGDRPLLKKFRERLPAGVQLGKPQPSLLGSWRGLGDQDESGGGDAGIRADDLQLDVSPPSISGDVPDEATESIPAQKASRRRADDQSSWDGEVDPSETKIGQLIVEAVTAELTTIVAGPTESWRLDPLRRDLQTVIDESTDPIVRGEARLLLERVDEFDAFRLRWLKNHSRQIASNSHTQLDSERDGIAVSTASYQKSAPTSAQVSIAADADANGYLVAVRSQRTDYPQYALTDRAGNLVAYVEARPGMSLQPYLDQPVAIYGQRGMNTLLAARSIRVERILRVMP